MKDEWGPWVEHDGNHMPPHRAVCQATFCDGETLIGVVDHYNYTHQQSFLWGYDECVSHVIRYRIRKPRGMEILEGIMENVPNKVRADA
jgi:hypothetical protein